MAFKLKNWDAGKVIDAFRELKLEVLDDTAEIKTAFGKRQAYYVRLRDSPDPDEQRQGEVHFENGTVLQNDSQRSELLDLVYGKFANLGDATMAAGQMKTANSGFRTALKNIGKTECNYQDSLCEKAYQRFLKERGIVEGKDIKQNSAEPIEAFSVEAIGKEKLALTWKNPSKNFEKVVIRNRNTKSQVYSGTSSRCEVSDLSPGQYEFEAITVYNGVEEPKTRTTTKGVSMGEVEEAKAVFSGGSISLNWKNPNGATSTAVFRRANSKPIVKKGEASPADSNTKKVFQGKSDSFEDTSDLDEGVTYHYLFAAIYANGCFTVGKETTVAIPKAPEGVSSLDAILTSDAEISLSWPKVSGGPGLTYCLYRREGDTPPGADNEQERISVGQENRFIDSDVDPGRRYTYSLYTAQGGLWGKSAASSIPVLVTEEVKNLFAQAGDEVVTLTWDVPNSGTGVQIRRSLSPPEINSGTVVPATGPNRAVDSGVSNGREYNYLISIVYDVPGIGKVYSNGIRTSAVPEPLPEIATEFEVQGSGSEAHCSWVMSSKGKPRLYRSATPFSTANSRMAVTEMEVAAAAAEASEVPVSGPGKAVDVTAAPSAPYYSIFSVSGGNAIAGQTVTCAVCPDISELNFRVRREGVELRWTWPPSCKAVSIARRANEEPESVKDSKAVVVLVSRNSYESNGMKYVDRMTGTIEGNEYHYRAFAQGHGTSEYYYANAVKSDTKTNVIWRKPMALRYDFEKRKGKKKLFLRVKLEDRLPDFAGFVILASEKHLPKNVNDGEEMLLFQGDENERIDGARVPLEKIPSHWRSFYLKLILLDHQQAERIFLIHPNISNEFNLDGEPVDRGASRFGKVWKPVTPSRIRCASPKCNKEIEVTQIKFGEFGVDPADDSQWKTGKKQWGGGVQPPKNENGRLLLRKICPHCSADLPFSAGTIESKSISVIGSKGSGKTTYLVSLIHQLKNRVCSDFNAALRTQSQGTSDLFEANERDLFQKHKRLEFTLAANSLIYDIVFDGSCWGDKKQRAVTLPFFDTPGDNFSTVADMEQYASYLRNSDAVILNVDPLQDPKVYDALPDFPTVGEQQSPSKIIENLANFMNKEQIDIPVAIVFSKADTLLAGGEGGLIDPHRLWASDRNHRRVFDLELHDDCAGLWMEFAEEHFPDAASQIKAQFSRFAFFGSSATGAHQDITGKYPFVSPHRVEDPFLWMFYNLGIIPGERNALY